MNKHHIITYILLLLVFLWLGFLTFGFTEHKMINKDIKANSAVPVTTTENNTVVDNGSEEIRQEEVDTISDIDFDFDAQFVSETEAIPVEEEVETQVDQNGEPFIPDPAS